MHECRCKYNFDPFRTATFTIEPQSPDASIPDDVAIAIDYGSGMASSGILKKYTWIKTRKQVMDHVRGGINAMKRSFFVHTQAEGKSPEIFETSDHIFRKSSEWGDFQESEALRLSFVTTFSENVTTFGF